MKTKPSNQARFRILKRKIFLPTFLIQIQRRRDCEKRLRTLFGLPFVHKNRELEEKLFYKESKKKESKAINVESAPLEFSQQKKCCNVEERVERVSLSKLLEEEQSKHSMYSNPGIKWFEYWFDDILGKPKESDCVEIELDYGGLEPFASHQSDSDDDVDDDDDPFEVRSVDDGRTKTVSTIIFSSDDEEDESSSESSESEAQELEVSVFLQYLVRKPTTGLASFGAMFEREVQPCCEFGKTVLHVGDK